MSGTGREVINQDLVEPRRKPSILYLTYGGLLEPLVYAQGLRPLLRLAPGYSIRVVSLERARDLEDSHRVEKVRSVLGRAGIMWTPLRYSFGPAGAVSNLGRLTVLALWLAKGRRAPSVVWARSYLPAVAAYTVHQRTSIPYLFDARGYWVDEHAEKDTWSHLGRTLAAARAIERRLYSSSKAVVLQTELGVQDVRGGRFGDCRSVEAVCIPPSVDHEEFGRGEAAGLPEGIRQRLAGKLVVGYVGSFADWYLSVESFRLFLEIRELCPIAHLLCLTRQQDTAVAHARMCGVRSEDLTVAMVPHEAMPDWLSAMQWGLLLLRSSPAKRASVPTKLGEFFAAGVRPLFHGCNGEAVEWVARAGSGYVLEDCSEVSLAQAARHVAKVGHCTEGLDAARGLAASSFSLDAAVRRYDEVLRRIVS